MAKRLLLALVVIVAFALVVVYKPPPGPRSTKVFDPDRLADLEVEMWKAYYTKQKRKLFELLVTMLHDQVNFSWGKASECGFYLARAANTFGDARGNYDRVLPDLERAYTLERDWTHAGFSPEKVARAELAWWVARRDPKQHATENVGRLIGEMYALFYEVPFEKVAEAGVLRAQAATVRDRSRRDPDWAEVSTLLHKSYRSLRSQFP